MLSTVELSLTSIAFIPHGHCYLWKPGLMWLHISSDVLIAIAYYSIPLTLLYFVRERKDLPFGWMFLLFSLFIIACGTTHLMGIWTLWHPTYWLSGYLKAGTASVSLFTAIALIPLIPKALSLPSPDQLEAANRELEREILERKQIEAALRESEEKFRQLAENIDEVFWISHPWKPQLVYVSPAYEKVWGRSCESLQKDFTQWIKAIHIDDRQRVERAFFEKVFQGLYDEEYRILRPDGIIRWIRDRGFPVKTALGKVLRIAGLAEDITDRKLAQEKLEQSEARYRAVVEDQTDLVCRFLPDNTFTFVNDAYCRYFERTREELIGQSWVPKVVEEDLDHVGNQLATLSLDNPVVIITNRIIRPNGDIHMHQWVNRAIFDGQGQLVEYQAVGRDITELQQTQELQAALQEKEVLLKEIHHRVKNNLQIIYSLLRLQRRAIQDQRIANILLDSQNRIKSIALIHEKLYRSADLSQINLTQYIPNLVASLFSSYQVQTNQTVLNTKIDEIALDIDTAIPCGLIINELISNSLKYAFPEGRVGEIYVVLQASKDEIVSLIVGDNGVGIPENFDLIKANSLGLKLVHDLVKQLEGIIEIDRSRGTEFRITFPRGQAA